MLRFLPTVHYISIYSCNLNVCIYVVYTREADTSYSFLGPEGQLEKGDDFYDQNLAFDSQLILLQ